MHVGFVHLLGNHFVATTDFAMYMYEGILHMKFKHVCMYLFTRELFNAAFVSCWMELRPLHQEDLVTNLKQALSLQNSPDITQTILNLAEFMEHCEEATVSVGTGFCGSQVDGNGGSQVQFEA